MNSGTPASSTTTVVGIPLTLGQLFDRAWKVVREQLALSMGLTLIYCLAVSALMKIPYVGNFLPPLILTGYIACLLKLRAKQEFEFKDFFWPFQNINRLAHVILSTLLSTVLLTIGFILLFIPGIWLMVSLTFTNFFLVVENQDGVNSLRSSHELVKGNWWRVAGLLAFNLLLLLLGILCLGVGALVAIPVIVLMLIETAEDLQRSKGQLPQGMPGAEATPATSTFAVNPQQ